MKGLATLIFAFSAFSAAILPDKSKTFIERIISGGSGCKTGTVSATISSDLTTFTLILDDFVALTGPGFTIKDSRKNCQINVDLRYPQGWSYSIISVDYRGYVNLPEGVSATQTSTYYFSGNTEEVNYSTNYIGPFQGDYLQTDKASTEATIWSPCGQIIQGNINTKVSITTNDYSKSAQVTVDSIDGKVKQIYGVQWKKC